MDNEIYTKHGITFNTLKHLDTIGLISFESVAGYRKMRLGKSVMVGYYGRPTQVTFPADNNNDLNTGHVLLTTTGKELAPVCGSGRNEEFYEYVIRKWYQQELILSSIVGNRGW